MKKTGSKSEAKTELLDRCVKYFISAGLGDFSLRSLADQIGTSHRMLIYHFGTREDLLLAMLDRFRTHRINSQLEEIENVRTWPDFEQLLRKVWKELSSKEMRSFMITFYEASAHSLRRTNTSEASHFLEASLKAWSEPVIKILRRLGLSARESRQTAIYIVGALRGLNLLGLGAASRAEADRAFEVFLASLKVFKKPAR